MKTLTFNFVLQIHYYILRMQEWSEQRWKEITSPSISDLFAQARRDMEEGKPLPELPQMPTSCKLVDYPWVRIVWITIITILVGIICSSESFLSDFRNPQDTMGAISIGIAYYCTLMFVSWLLLVLSAWGWLIVVCKTDQDFDFDSNSIKIDSRFKRFIASILMSALRWDFVFDWWENTQYKRSLK